MLNVKLVVDRSRRGPSLPPVVGVRVIDCTAFPRELAGSGKTLVVDRSRRGPPFVGVRVVDCTASARELARSGKTLVVDRSRRRPSLPPVVGVRVVIFSATDVQPRPRRVQKVSWQHTDVVLCHKTNCDLSSGDTFCNEIKSAVLG